jgi:hypothetical protein
MVCTDRECSVCYGEDGVFQKLSCGHDFCSGCIKTWYLKGTGTGCPMCRAPIYFKGFHKVRDEWNEDAHETKCSEVFGEAIDACVTQAFEYAEAFPKRWRSMILREIIEDVKDLERTYRALVAYGAGPEEIDDAFYYEDYYSDRHLDKCSYLDEPLKESVPSVQSRSRGKGFKRSRARQDPWVTMSFYYIEV